MDCNRTRTAAEQTEPSMSLRSPLPHSSSIPASPNNTWAYATPSSRPLAQVQFQLSNISRRKSLRYNGHPKMDSGMTCKYYSVDEAIEDGVAPVPISSDRTTDVQCT